jgi:hypothetical protein
MPQPKYWSRRPLDPDEAAALMRSHAVALDAVSVRDTVDRIQAIAFPYA